MPLFLSQSFELDFWDPEVFGYPAVIIIIFGILNENKNIWVPKNLLDFINRVQTIDLKKGYSNDEHTSPKATLIWSRWYGMVYVCDGYLAAEASGSSFG